MSSNRLRIHETWKSEGGGGGGREPRKGLMRGCIEMRLVSKTLVLFPHTANNQCFRPGGVTPIDSIVTAATAGQTLTGSLRRYGLTVEHANFFGH